MPSIAKPLIVHPGALRNEIGLTQRDYEGAMSTLCAGCGHDSVTAAIVRALWELSIEPHMLAKMSGIGCSSKTPAYFVSGAHGFNSAHGRMPPIATGANAANRELLYIGVSGDGDSLSIGLGHLCHAMRRNLRMVYLMENNGVYGLTKGQFSASADVGSRSKRGEANRMSPIDPMLLGLSLGATFLARGFSGDKEHLVPILKAAIAHRGFAFVDIISPCVTFNDHNGSTKSYLYMRQNQIHATETDFVPLAREVLAEIGVAGEVAVTMHDGSVVKFKQTPLGYDPTDYVAAARYLEEHAGTGKVVTGLLYVNEESPDLHELNHTPDHALTKVPYEKLCPGSRVLAEMQQDWR